MSPETDVPTDSERCKTEVIGARSERRNWPEAGAGPDYFL